MAETPQKQQTVIVGSNSPATLQLKGSDADIAITLDVTNKFLRTIYTKKSETQTLTELLNEEIQYIRLAKSDRLESRLYSEGSRIRSEYSKIKGGNKQAKHNQKIRKIAIMKNEIENFSEIQIHQLLNEPISTPKPRITRENEKENNSYANEGPRIDNSSKSMKKKVIRNLEENVNKALDFVETYGALPKSLVCESFDGESHVLSLDGSQTPGRNPNFNGMTSTDKLNVRKVLQVCDNSMISDSAYHELAMHVPEMPRKHLLVSCRNDVNSNFEVKRTPGMLPGSYLSLQKELIKELEYAELEGMPLLDTLKIKISGDSAKVSRISNFIVISYAHLDTLNTLSHLNQRVLAVLKCEENYENLDKSCVPIFAEINDLDKDGITLGDKKIKVEIFVGGDMKFLQILLGLSSSIATYACPWCKVAKDDRGNMSFPIDHYHTIELRRSISDIKSLAASSSKQKYGVKHAPLLNIEVDHFVPDELHLLMRIMDILLRNLMDDALSKDQFAKIRGGPTDNVSLLVKAIQGCGVTFRTWSTKSGDLEWTSLSGNDFKKVLINLPDKLIFCVHEDTVDSVRQLWKQFSAIHAKITKQVPSDSPDEVFIKVKDFITNFLAIGQKGREGYHPKNITPYMHCLVYHVPTFLKMYGSLFPFSGQGVEKTNDVLK